MAEKTRQNQPSGSIGTEETLYKCRLCGKMYGTKGGLKKHIILHSAEQKTHKCSLCPKAFKTKQEMTAHSRVHSNDKPHACTECNAKFKRKATLIFHTRQHGQEFFLCELCGKTLKTKKNLANHQVVHSEDRLFRCTKCTLTFKRNGELTRHTRRHKSGAKPHTCDQCGTSFFRLSGLNRHKYQVRDTSYNCDQCSEVFSHKCGLKAHRSIHTAPSYSCQLCGLSYTQKSNLNRHLKTHTKSTSSAQSDSRCDDPDRPTVFTSTNEELLSTPTPTVRGIPYPSQTNLEDHSNTSTVHGAVPKTKRDIQGRHNAGGKLLTNPSATREIEDAIRGTPIHSSQPDSSPTRLGMFTSLSLNRNSESNQRDITFSENKIGQVSSIAQHATQNVAERAAADPGRVPSLVQSDPLEELADMMDGVEERERSRLADMPNINHHIDPHIQQYQHQLQQQQVAEELLQMVQTVATPTDPTTSRRSERMNH